ncbi:MAG: pyruvate kinase [Flavobacteriales bacterium]|nr:pyruvate kinase [Flavobacteriales bacterium]
MNKRKTKIVATIGPVTSSKENLIKLIASGVNVCRLNFSHSTHEEHIEVIKNIREADKELGTHTAILGDLQGPKIRIGEVKDNNIELVPGAEIIITTNTVLGTAEKVSITYQGLPQDVKKGERILLDDGKLMFEVISTNLKDEVKLKVIHGGYLSSKKGVNLPNTKISQPSLTEKDKKDLQVILEQNLDWIGLSFVRSAKDIIELKHIISQNNKQTKVVAKIEKPEAVIELENIVKESDAVMVARGDLGVEIPMQDVPLIQKKIITTCLNFAKPVIVATQMMESMTENAAPTRAEVNDVANAVMDGADAVMLSGETSVGKYPFTTVEAMCKILEKIESDYEEMYSKEREPEKDIERFITDSICFTSCRLASRVEAKGIITMTHSGYTAYKISSQRPKAAVYVFSGNKKLLTQLSLVWGVTTFFYDKTVSTDHTIADIKYLLKKQGYVSEGDMIINTASIPIEENGKTNMMKMSVVE